MTKANPSLQAPDEVLSIPSVVGQLAHAMREQHRLTPGDVAELRRLDPADPGAAFWKTAAIYLEPMLARSEEARRRDERAWSIVLNALALCKGAHEPRTALGSSLFEADVSEMRLQALLRADLSSIGDHIRGVAQLTQSRGVRLNFAEVARLVLYAPHTDAGERVRRQIARRYYATSYRKEKNS